MSIYLERHNYLKEMCKGHPVVLHDAVKADGSKRRSFFRINDEEEITASVFSGIDFPCVAYMSFSGRLTDSENALVDIRHSIQNEWWFITQVPLHTQEGEGMADRIEQAYDLTFAIMEDFIRSMKEEFEENGSCGIFNKFDLNRISYDQTGAVVEHEYGWRLIFTDEAEADRITGGSPTDIGDIVMDNGAVELEIIHFNNVPDFFVLWNSSRKQRFGAMPTVQVYLVVDGVYQLSTIQPVLDVPPPYMSRMDFNFSGHSTGFILIK